MRDIREKNSIPRATMTRLLLVSRHPPQQWLEGAASWRAGKALTSGRSLTALLKPGG